MKTIKVLSIVWHSVEPDSINPAFLAGTNPTASLFREQIQFLVENFTPISIREFEDIIQDRSLLGSYKRPPLLLSFDDGFKNVVDQALPVLNEFQVPAVFFVIGEILKKPDFIPWYVEGIHLLRRTFKRNVVFENVTLDPTLRAGQSRLNSLLSTAIEARRDDKEREALLEGLAERLGVQRPTVRDLDDDLRFVARDDLSKLGSSSLLTVASHAMTHRFLPSLSPEEQFHELRESHTLLSGCSPSYYPALAYPGGSFNAATTDIARETYKCAFAICLGASYRNAYAYPRITIGNDRIDLLAYAISPKRLTYVIPLKRFLHHTGIRSMS